MGVIMNIRKITQMAERNSGYGWNCCVLSIPKTLIYRISGTIVKSLINFLYLFNLVDDAGVKKKEQNPLYII